MEEILVYVARFFDNNHVAMCVGVVGKNLAIGMKALSDRLRPLYDSYLIPTGIANRICSGAASPQRGRRNKEEDHILSEQDIPTWAPYELDHYQGGGQLGPGNTRTTIHPYRNMKGQRAQYGAAVRRRVWIGSAG